ncbi:amidase [Mesorhizobium sp. M8A.F.Ca.ET.208.01.1.1]|uniref:amidase n=1 Tax=unclassified Mesorhizobium TaxID=325217 RepID=UPI0010939A65|nr:MULTISPECIES: amidase [unclassified Mesorhizobium]TGQ89086.1 amidase [Mesorhizobium sp. M8A.F.Ca.ET.208.01.1.1]TGR32191.1 amidase [Mesorhizobium sp. M8A.F.Ca.ET.202.01.1.1]TGT50406.1 amidase [Mesorhizobium sp. M8A.F.Ca.ET.167.01.1.1]TGU40069.1 amidase [bacterium M00.F.Ca.ET.156.01.1.1]
MDRKCAAVERLDRAIAAIGDPNLDGMVACPTVYSDGARAAATAADARAKAGISLGPLDGAIVTIKDLFDVAGEVTRAGSVVLAGEGKVATRDAVAVNRMRAAGVIIVAKTNMSEFAFSGVGTNPHLGTPRNPLDTSRVPGGSSSGAAVAVARDFCEIGIGTDTGGSTRIPAALCRLVGFKPTSNRISTRGAFPLSESLDCVGPIARTVDACASADAVLAGVEDDQAAVPLAGLRVGVVQGLPFEGIDAAIAESFDRALQALAAAGCRVTDVMLTELDGMREVNAKGGIATAEAFALHRHRLSQASRIDPNILVRIERGKTIGAADYIDMIRGRGALAASVGRSAADCDVLVMPTVPIVAPTLEQVASAAGFTERNALLLRNTAIANFFDLPAISLPVEGLPGAALMMIGQSGRDRRLLAMARSVEACLGE